MSSVLQEKPKNDFADVEERTRQRLVGRFARLYTAPWWLAAFIALWIYLIVQITASEEYSRIFDELREGISLTLFLAITSYILALIVGLLTGIVRANPPKPPEHGMRTDQVIGRSLQTVLYNAVTFYVEFMRGIPPLVFLLISGFILVPAMRDVINTSIVPTLRDLFNDETIPELVWRGRDNGTAIAGLSLIYGAFLSEIFRAGIQAVDKGQIEAAKSLGMSYYLVLRHIIIPQAVRRMLPPIGNDFISMIKDTSLVTILGINEITQLARKWSGSTFQYVETYAVLSMIYLMLTITGSMLVQIMERRLSQNERD